MLFTQVHKLFEEMSPPPENDNESELYPPPPFLASHPLGPAPFMIGGPGPQAWETGSMTSDYEFYPVDPISRFVQVYRFTIPTLIVSLLEVCLTS